MVKVSVIFSVYNVEKYLEQCLDSIINQTLTDIEVFCVDDGSTDSSLEILQNYAEKDSRIKVIPDGKHLGAGRCRNVGLSMATGKYLCVLDSDDFFEPTMLEKAYNACEKYQAQVCVFDSDRYDIQADKFYPCPWGIRKEFLPSTNFDEGVVFNPREIADDIYRVFNGCVWDKLFLREFVEAENIVFQEVPTAEDLYFVYSALVRAKKITVIDDVLTHYRFNIPTSLNNSRYKNLDSICLAIKKIKEKLEEYGEYKTYEKGYTNRVVHTLWWNMYTVADHKLKEAFELSKETWNELNFPKHELEYYYNLAEYEEVTNVCNLDFEDYLITKISQYKNESQKQRNKLFEKDAEIKNYKNELQNQRIEVTNSKHKIQKQLNKIQEMQTQISNLHQQIYDIKVSKTYRVGELILYIPKKLIQILKRRNG